MATNAYLYPQTPAGMGQPGAQTAQFPAPQYAQNPYQSLGLGGAINPQTGVMAAGTAPQMPGGANPYLGQQADAIRQQVNQSLFQNQMPQINRGAVLNGGYGGSRQGIAQGLGLQGANNSIANATANLYGQAYESDANRANQYDIASMQNQTTRDLGFGNLGLGQQGLDNNFYTAQRGQDLQAQQQGYNQGWGNIYNSLGLGQAETNIGNQQQQAGFSPLQQYGSVIGPFSGLNGSTNTSAPATGGGVAGAAGGALTIAQIIALLSKGG